MNRLASIALHGLLTRAAAAVLVCLALQACSAAVMAYSQAPALAQWRLDAYLDLSRAQAERLHAELTTLHRWHRREQLPRQLAQLQGVQRQLAADLTPQSACATYETVLVQLDELLHRAEPTLVWLAMSLERGQIEHLQRRLAQVQAEEAREAGEAGEAGEGEGDGAALRDARYESWLARSESLYGRLDAGQKAVLGAALAASQQDSEPVRAWRQARQEDWLATLRAIQQRKPPVDAARLQVRALLERSRTPADPERRALAQRLRQDGCRVFALVHNTTTAPQRQRAARTLAAYEVDFRSLLVAGASGT